MTRALRDAVQPFDVIRRNLRPLDCGHHYCRYCDAGTHNGWLHGLSCPYELSVREVEQAQKALADVLARLGEREQEKEKETLARVDKLP